jgi:hypothetical protein
MSKLTILKIQSAFDTIKRLAEKEFEHKNYELSLKYIETAADMAYSYNWIYMDEVLENLLMQISEAVIKENKTFVPIANRIVFYDVFAFDNKGLTQQYLRALISWGVDLLFVFDGNDLSNSKQILHEIASYSKAELFILENSLTKAEKINRAYHKILDFKPEKAFLHLRPSSVVAVSVFNALPEVTRYLINLTDHAFWLGAKCLDYSLEFRDYGCTVSYEKRNLSKNQLLIQPYYPILECKSFIGFPSSIPNDTIKIFTGGSYYKMYGKSNLFFTLLQTLIEMNAKVVVLLAGNGDAEPLKQFISDNNYENRLFLLGSRPDITHVFEHCDIYLSTYPVTGGLMGQYAACLSKPVLSYTSGDIPSNFAEGFLNWNATSDFKITHTTLDSFRSEAFKMIESASYREKLGVENKKHIISPEEFSLHLKQLVRSNKMEVPYAREVIDYDVFMNIYLESENKYLKQFDSFIVSRFKLFSFVYFPKQALTFLLSQANWKFAGATLWNKLVNIKA